MSKPKDYQLAIWANGFREWHGKITFLTPIGNTAEAEKMISRATRYAKQNLRRIVAASDGIGAGYRLQYEIVKSKQLAATNQLLSIEWRVIN